MLQQTNELSQVKGKYGPIKSATRRFSRADLLCVRVRANALAPVSVDTSIASFAKGAINWTLFSNFLPGNILSHPLVGHLFANRTHTVTVKTMAVVFKRDWPLQLPLTNWHYQSTYVSLAVMWKETLHSRLFTENVKFFQSE